MFADLKSVKPHSGYKFTDGNFVITFLLKELYNF